MASDRSADLIRALRTRPGGMGAGELRRVLDVSQPTLSRALGPLVNEVLTLGKGRGTRYALPRVIPGVPQAIPMFAVDEAGVARRSGTLFPLLGGPVWVQRNEGDRGRMHDGLPYFIDDMRPQGYLGRAFARFHADLELPDRITDWNDDHVLRALCSRGEDTTGNLLVGEGSFHRFMSACATAPALVPVAEQGAAFDQLAALASAGQPPASSAGGERPKFTAYTTLPDGQPAHVLVKFSPPRSSEAGQRWSDLLICEALAGEVLSAGGIRAARSRFVPAERMHLVVERFDRCGPRGRRALVSLAALDDHYFGNRDNYTSAAIRMEKARLIAAADAQALKTAHCFGILIGNTDMHFGNVSFFPKKTDRFSLAPIYDMLPMCYAPLNDQLVDREFSPPALPVQAMECWNPAYRLADEFWARVAEHPQISDAFKVMVSGNREKVAARRELHVRQAVPK